MNVAGRVENLIPSDYLAPAILTAQGAGLTALSGVCELIPVIPQKVGEFGVQSGLGVMAAGALFATGVAIAHRLGFRASL